MNKAVTGLLLFIVAFSERIFWDLGPGWEMITSVMILGLFYLGHKNTFRLVLLLMFLTDIIIGNTSIIIFTWSGMLLPLLFARTALFDKIRAKKSALLRITGLVGLGWSANIFFFFWTNLGVWLLDSWGMYTKNYFGLIQCYLNALPFFKNQLLSSLVFISSGFVIEIILQAIYRKIILKNRNFQFLN